MVWQAEPRSFVGRGFFILACAAFMTLALLTGISLDAIVAFGQVLPAGRSSVFDVLLDLGREDCKTDEVF